MQGKNITHEPFIFKNISVRNQLFASANRHESVHPPIVCILIPATEAPLAASFLRRILGIPGAAYLIVDAGPYGTPADRKEAELGAIVQQNTIMPVLVAEQGMTVQNNQVYVVSSELSLQHTGNSLAFRLGVLSTRGDGMVDNFLAAMAAVVTRAITSRSPGSRVKLTCLLTSLER